jgi:phosphatidylinositol alpha-mannosyltransferase
MALATPVVFLDWPDSAIPELVRDGVEGVMSSPDPSSLARASKILLEDEARRAAMGAAGQRRAAEYDWPRVAERFETLFGAIMAAKSPPAPGPEVETETAADREEP